MDRVLNLYDFGSLKVLKYETCKKFLLTVDYLLVEDKADECLTKRILKGAIDSAVSEHGQEIFLDCARYLTRLRVLK
jgi:hypothetical protein